MPAHVGADWATMQKSPSTWGLLVSMPSHAADSPFKEIFRAASDFVRFVNVSIELSEEVSSAAAVPSSQKEEAAQLLADFCRVGSSEAVEPTEEELQALWTRCSLLHAQVLNPQLLVGAIRPQLRLATGQRPGAGCGKCPAQYRALCVAENLHNRGVVGQTVLGELYREATDRALVERLCDVPFCEPRARKVLGLAAALVGDLRSDGTLTASIPQCKDV